MSFSDLSSKSLKKYSISDREFLNKRLKTSTRYAKVKSKTNSGFNAKRRLEIEKEIKKYYKVKNDEVFQRISLKDLLHLMIVYAEESTLTRFQMGECGSTDEGLKNMVLSENKPASYDVKDDVGEVIHRIDDLDIVPPTIECPFLILDVRSNNEFIRGHLATSVCHPISRLSRAVGWECQEMITYKNHPDFIIVICDESETQSPEFAATLIHRGYTNVFVLSGGLRLARDKIGPPLVTTDQSKALSTAVADFLIEKLSNDVIPPLKMDGAANWWGSKAQRIDSEDSGVEETQRSRSKSRGRYPQDEKPKHWR